MGYYLTDFLSHQNFGYKKRCNGKITLLDSGLLRLGGGLLGLGGGLLGLGATTGFATGLATTSSRLASLAATAATTDILEGATSDEHPGVVMRVLLLPQGAALTHAPVLSVLGNSPTAVEGMAGQ